ncbi:MAG: hypothetical protein H6937_05620 [Burkholderiales bacterium]|nr:hypothetical protein [Burkholderiales bacterium]
MLTPSKTFHQPSLFETDLLLQLDPTDPLLKLSTVIPWHVFESIQNSLARHHSDPPTQKSGDQWASAVSPRKARFLDQSDLRINSPPSTIPTKSTPQKYFISSLSKAHSHFVPIKQ